MLYFISDTHFDHGNIIEYCDRNFDSVDEMNSRMINNWNNRVSYSDTVIHGGDIATHMPEETISYAQKLNGKLTLIAGNHDVDVDKRECPFSVQESMYFEYEDDVEYSFYYSHFPSDYQSKTRRDDDRLEPVYASTPDWFDGWNIHGHVHNHDLEVFPFVNQESKTVNVGAELLDYTPIQLVELVEILKSGESYETISEVPSGLSHV